MLCDFVIGGPNKNGTVLEVKGWEGETDVSFSPRVLLCVKCIYVWVLMYLCTHKEAYA